MANVFRINLKYQLKSLSEAGIILIVSLGALAVFFIFAQKKIDDLFPFTGLISLYLSTFYLPALFLHTHYYITNFTTQLLIEEGIPNHFTISEKNRNCIFKSNDVTLVERHLGIFYKNRIDRKGRFAAPWSDMVI